MTPEEAKGGLHVITPYGRGILRQAQNGWDLEVQVSATQTHLYQGLDLSTVEVDDLSKPGKRGGTQKNS